MYIVRTNFVSSDKDLLDMFMVSMVVVVRGWPLHLLFTHPCPMKQQCSCIQVPFELKYCRCADVQLLLWPNCGESVPTTSHHHQCSRSVLHHSHLTNADLSDTLIRLLFNLLLFLQRRQTSNENVDSSDLSRTYQFTAYLCRGIFIMFSGAICQESSRYVCSLVFYIPTQLCYVFTSSAKK